MSDGAHIRTFHAHFHLKTWCHRLRSQRGSAVFWLGERNWFGHLGASSDRDFASPGLLGVRWDGPAGGSTYYLVTKGRFVLAQGGAVELKFPGKNFFRSIPSNYGPYKHPGAVFANFGSQVGFLCSDCAESDRIDYHALTSDHVRLMAHACVTSSSIAPTIRRFQPQVH